jgi:hypothetical protein
MADAAIEGPVDLERLLWLGPVTVATSVAAVVAVRTLAVWLLDPPRTFSPLGFVAPVTFTAVLVVAAVVGFAIIACITDKPLRLFRLIALAALLISLWPCVTLAGQSIPGAGWPAAVALMAMHVAAWYATVTMLARFTVVRRGPA